MPWWSRHDFHACAAGFGFNLATAVPLHKRPTCCLTDIASVDNHHTKSVRSCLPSWRSRSLTEKCCRRVLTEPRRPGLFGMPDMSGPIFASTLHYGRRQTLTSPYSDPHHSNSAM